MFHIVPVLLIGVALWLERGMPRPSRAVVVAGVVAALAVFVLPYAELLNSGLVNDTLGLLPLLDWVIELHGGLNELRILMAAGVLVVVVLFALTPRAIARVALPCAVGAFFVVSSFGIFEHVRRAGIGYRSAPSVGADANWVDRVVGPGEEVLFLGPLTEGFSDAQKIRWQTEFFNRSVAQVLALDANIGVDQDTGIVSSLDPGGQPLDGRYVLVDGGLRLVGQPLIERPPLTLYEVDGPIRIADLTSGVFPDGWTGQTASLNAYASESSDPVQVDVTVGLTGWTGPDVPANVEIVAGTLEVGEDGAAQIGEVVFAESVELHAGEQSSYTIDAPPGPVRVEIVVDRTFSPADFGLGDPRQLGVQFGYGIR